MENRLDECLIFEWDELIKEAKKRPARDLADIDMESDRPNIILPNAYPWFYYMDSDNNPDLRRFFHKVKELGKALEESDYFDHMITVDMGMKLIIDKNPCYRKYPLIYVKDESGKIYDIHELDQSLLINTEIYVLDESIKNPAHVIALLGFYLEYPIRVKRIQKEHAVRALLQKI